MEIIDIFILIPLLWGAFRGFVNGLIKELALLTGFALGIWLASGFSEKLAKLMGLENDYRLIISYSILFLGTLILILYLSKLLDKVLKGLSLNWLSKIAGALFGIFKYALIISAFFFFINAAEKSYPIIKKESKSKSLMYGPVSKIAPLVIPSLRNSSNNN